MSDHPRAAQPDAELDVVGSPDSPSRLVSAWAGLSPGRRALIRVAGAVLLAGGVLGGALGAVVDWRSQHAQEDVVSLRVQMNVSASSSTPTGGRVDFYLSVENTGRLPVSVTAVDLQAPRLTITGDLSGRGFPLRPVQPGEVARVPLSVILDCRTAADPTQSPGPLMAVVEAVPASGRSRPVSTEVGRATAVTGIADTLCAIDPELHDDQLDGPVQSF